MKKRLMAFEKSITNAILNYLNSLPDCIAEKTKGDSTSSGRADINGCFRGLAFRIEVKTPDNKNVASTKQKINLRKWYNAGALVMVTYSLQFVKMVFSKLSAQKKLHVKHSEQNNCMSWAKKRS